LIVVQYSKEEFFMVHFAHPMYTEAAYSKKFEQLIQEDQVEIAKMKTEVEQTVKELILDYGTTLTIEKLPLRRWIARFPRLTMKNIAPYTPNGDINNAIFSLPADINSRDLRTWLIDWRTFDLFIPNNSYVWKPVIDVIGEECKTKQEMKRRAKLDKPETGARRRQELEKYFLTTLNFTATCKVDGCKRRYNCLKSRKETENDMLPYRDFSERMAKCTADFEKFCQK
jgi:hypothetical protein